MATSKGKQPFCSERGAMHRYVSTRSLQGLIPTPATIHRRGRFIYTGPTTSLFLDAQLCIVDEIFALEYTFADCDIIDDIPRRAHECADTQHVVSLIRLLEVLACLGV